MEYRAPVDTQKHVLQDAIRKELSQEDEFQGTSPSSAQSDIFELDLPTEAQRRSAGEASSSGLPQATPVNRSSQSG